MQGCREKRRQWRSGTRTDMALPIERRQRHHAIHWLHPCAGQVATVLIEFPSPVQRANTIAAGPNARRPVLRSPVVRYVATVTWQRAVGGRIKSDLRFNKLLTWNTFPLPPTDTDARRRIIGAAQEVPAARQLQPDLSLADLYAPTTMSNELQHAHHALDGEVDQLFGLASQHPTEPERQDVLFTRHQAMTAMSRPPLRRASTSPISVSSATPAGGVPSPEAL